MASINSVIITGNLTNDPEFRAVGKNYAVSFSVANNRSEKKNDEWIEVPSFFNVKTWARSDSQKGFYEKVLKKGAGVIIDGQLVQERWEKDGQKNSRVVINATTVIPSNGHSSEKSSGSSNTASESVPTDTDQFPEDIPF